MLGGERLQFLDHGICVSAGDFGLGVGGVSDDLLVVQSLGKGFNELEVAQVVEDGASPLRQRRRQVAAGLLELRGRGGSQSGVFASDETAKIVLVVGNGESVPGRRACQDSGVGARATHQATQVGYVRV